MEIKFYGHSCFLIEASGKRLLFDPFISGNDLAKEIDLDSIQADFIFVSHAHQDHLLDLLYLAKRTGAQVVGAYEFGSWLAKQGVTNFHPMNLGGSFLFDSGKVKMTYASHSSSFPDGSYGGVAAGFLVESEGKVVYYSGDTCLNMEMKLLGELYSIDLALLPIGDNFTMGYNDASIAAGFLKTKLVVGLHFDTFGLIKIDHELAMQAFKEKGIKLTLLKIGEQITV